MADRFFSNPFPIFEHPPLTSFFPPHFDRPPNQGFVELPQKQGKVITVPVQDADAHPHHSRQRAARRRTRNRLQMDQPTAALKIQSCFRGYLVRRYNPLKHLRTIVNVKERLTEYEAEIQMPGVSNRIREDKKERLRITEGIMALLLQLDAVQGAHPEIRDLRKATTKRVIQLQEAVDAIGEGRQYSSPRSNDTGNYGQIPDTISVAGTDTSVGRLNDIGTSEELLETMPVAETDPVFADHSCKIDAFESGNPFVTAALTKVGGNLEPFINMQTTSSGPVPPGTDVAMARTDSSSLTTEDVPVHGGKISRDVLSPTIGSVLHYDKGQNNNSANDDRCEYGHGLAQNDFEWAPKCGEVQDIDSMDIYPDRELHGPAEPGVNISPEEQQNSRTSVEEERYNEERSSHPEGLILSAVQAPDGTIVKEQIRSNLENAVVPQDIGVVDKFTVANPDPEDLKAMESELYMHKVCEKCTVGEGAVLGSELSQCSQEQRPLDRELLEQLIEENRKLKQTLEELCKKNQNQDAMISLLSDKLEQLERRVTARRHWRPETDDKKKKRRAHSDTSL